MSEIGKNYLTEDLEATTQEVTMSVYTALNKRKIYAARLAKLKEPNVVFVDSAQASAEEIGGYKREDYVKQLKSNYDKAIAILRNFYSLNAAITQSNATTHITIGGVDMTVTEALSRYDKINQEIDLMNTITKNVATATSRISRMNADKLSEDAVSTYVSRCLSSIPNINTADDAIDESFISELRAKFREEYINRNTYELIDPYDHAGKIEDRIDSLRSFVSEFNEAINISNMSTNITVKLVGNE